MKSQFHVGDGLYFCRLDNGSVRIIKKADGMANSPVVFSVDIDDGGWVSAVLTMTQFNERPGDFHRWMDHHHGRVDVLDQDTRMLAAFKEGYTEGGYAIPMTDERADAGLDSNMSDAEQQTAFYKWLYAEKKDVKILTQSPAPTTITDSDGVPLPRRCFVDRYTPMERAIQSATAVIEHAGADPLLTDAVVLLNQAFEKVADYTDRLKGETDGTPKSD